MPTQALIVSTNASALHRYRAALDTIVDRIYTVATFQEARKLLLDATFDVLVTDVRLGAYNGIHLALWCSARSMGTRVVTIGPRDPVLETDAVQTGAWYILEQNDHTVGEAVGQALTRVDKPTRRIPRKRVALELPVWIGDLPARLVDVSYGGFCVEFPADIDPPSYDGVALDIPQFQLRAPARCVWVDPAVPGERRLGAAVDMADAFTDTRWRTMVNVVASAASPRPSL
jgi:hypothetical protein